jgi:hypothetical protein
MTRDAFPPCKDDEADDCCAQIADVAAAASYQGQQQPPTKDSHSHQPFPLRERATQRFRSMKMLQKTQLSSC